MANCFIVMPITTPETLVPSYGGDREHFHHVLEHLFVPAVEKAGLNAIRPLAQGADVIHAEIIKNIEQADVVLCDISSLNANVFFELGIRTALNKPVCVVKDELTTKIPFDTGIINHHTYSSSLAPWTLDKDVAALCAHLKSSVERSSGQNPLWRYFGITRPAILPDKPHDVSEQIELLRLQVEGVNRKIEEQHGRNATGFEASAAHKMLEERFQDELQKLNVPFAAAAYFDDPESWIVYVSSSVDEMSRLKWKKQLRSKGYSNVIFKLPD